MTKDFSLPRVVPRLGSQGNALSREYDSLNESSILYHRSEDNSLTPVLISLIRQPWCLWSPTDVGRSRHRQVTGAVRLTIGKN